MDEIALEKDGKQIGTTFSYTHPKEVTDKKGLVYEAEANAKAVNGKISGESQTFEISYKPKKVEELKRNLSIKMVKKFRTR